MKIPQSKIDEITSSIDIVDVISHVTPLRKAGRSFMGRCPFHEERSPSFSVSQEKGVYHCFGCGKSGNVYTFVMETENVTFFDAVKVLADKAGIQLEYENEPYDPDRNKIEVLYEINKQAGKYFYDNLLSRSGELAREYLKQRGLKDDMIKKFGLGYSLREKDALYNHFQNDFSEEDLIASGMVLNIAAKELRDRFRGRLMFPVFNESGKVIAFGGRRMYDEGSDEAKYINSPETRIYNKSKTLYGLNFAKQKIKETGYVILVEGYMDLISLFQYGIENVVASSGTSLTNLHVKILSRYTEEILLMYDSDLAGQNATRRAMEMIFENDIDLHIIPAPKGEDPDSYIKKYGIEEFQRLIINKQNYIDYIIEKYKTMGEFDTPEQKTKAIKDIITVTSKISYAPKRDFYTQIIADKFDIHVSSVKNEVEKLIKNNKKNTLKGIYNKPELQTKVNISNNISILELMLIRMLTESNNVIKKYILDNLELDLVTNPNIAKIVNYIMINIVEDNKISPASLFNEFTDATCQDILGKALLDDNYVIIEKDSSKLIDVQKLIIQLTLIKYKSLQMEIQKEIGIMQKEQSIKDDTNKTHVLRKELIVINNKIEEIKKSLKGLQTSTI